MPSPECNSVSSLARKSASELFQQFALVGARRYSGVSVAHVWIGIFGPALRRAAAAQRKAEFVSRPASRLIMLHRSSVTLHRDSLCHIGRANFFSRTELVCGYMTQNDIYVW
jgi:hypothetical protein